MMGDRKEDLLDDSALHSSSLHSASTRRSARLRQFNIHPMPVTKPAANMKSRKRPSQFVGGEDRQSEVLMEEASEGKKSKKGRRGRTQAASNAIGVTPPVAQSGNFQNADGIEGESAVELRLLVDEQKAADQSGEHLEPFSVQKLEEGRCITQDAELFSQSAQRYESPRTARINADNLPGHTKGASPRKSAKQQYFDASDSCHIQAVKSALHLSTVPVNMLCRDIEQGKVFEFCKRHLLQQQPGSLYICGCPGTGKSLLVEKVKLLAGEWAKEGALPAPEILSFNSTSFTNPSDIFERIFVHLSTQGNSIKSSKLSVLKTVKHALHKPTNKSTWRMLMLIVDEMDYLISKDQSVLYELFGLSAQADSRCILIGIANAIDLADRFLPKLNTLQCHPTVVPFCAYRKDQVLTVLKQRMQVLPFTVFEPAALELCARKVAAASGDMRKALHVCRIAVELFELEMKKGFDRKVPKNGIQNSKSEFQLSPSKKMNQKAKDKHHQDLVGMHHMAQALARTFRSAVVDTVKSLPKHQQMVLCAAVRLFRQKKKDATLGQLNVDYVEFCKSTDMAALSVPEFSSICRVLADQGLLNLGSSREDRLRRVFLQVDEDDIIFALQAVRFFRNSLELN